MSEKESVEQLAERIACNDVGGNYKSLDVERVTMSLQDFLRSHNIDPATMQPMDNVEKGCPMSKYETAWLIEAQNRIGGIPIWYTGLVVSGACVGRPGWTTDACKAQRFESKQDAETFIRLQGFDAIATEHGFDCTTVEQLQEGRDYAEIDVPTTSTTKGVTYPDAGEEKGELMKTFRSGEHVPAKAPPIKDVWLIKRKLEEGPIPRETWYAGDSSEGDGLQLPIWTTNPAKASQYSTKELAQAVIDMKGWRAVVDKHKIEVFSNAITNPTPSPPTKGVDREIAEAVLKASGVVNIGERRMDRDKFQDWLEVNIPAFLKPLRDELANAHRRGEELCQLLIESEQQLAESQERVKELTETLEAIEHEVSESRLRAVEVEGRMAVCRTLISNTFPQPTPSAGGTA